MALQIARLEKNPARVAALLGRGVWYEKGANLLSPKHKAIRAELMACAKALDTSTLPVLAAAFQITFRSQRWRGEDRFSSQVWTVKIDSRSQRRRGKMDSRSQTWKRQR